MREAEMVRMGDATPSVVIPGVWPPPGQPGYQPPPAVVPPGTPTPTPTPGGGVTDQAALTAIANAYGQMTPAGQSSAYAYVATNGAGASDESSARYKAAALGGAVGLVLGYGISKVLRKR